MARLLTGNESSFFHGNFRAVKSETGWGIINVISKTWYTQPVFSFIEFHGKYVEFSKDSKVAYYPIADIQLLDTELSEKENYRYYNEFRNSLQTQRMQIENHYKESKISYEMYKRFENIRLLIEGKVFYDGAIVKSTWKENRICNGNIFYHFEEGDIITFPFSLDDMIVIQPKYKLPYDGNLETSQKIPIHLDTKDIHGNPLSKVILIDPMCFFVAYPLYYSIDYIRAGGSFVEHYFKFEKMGDFLKDITQKRTQIKVNRKGSFECEDSGRKRIRTLYNFDFIN